MHEALVHRATHEVNNALNAVAMNLEVARLRAVPGADAGRVAPFAAAAAESHDEVVAMVQPLMALARGPLDGGCDVRDVAAQVVAVVAPGIRAKGGSLVLDGDGRGARTAVATAAVRLAIAELLLAASLLNERTPQSWRCTVTADPEPTFVLDSAGVLTRDGPVWQALQRAGVRAGSVAHTRVFPSDRMA